jgi:hypothetical protein
MRSGFDGDPIPSLNASTVMDSTLLVAIEAGSAVVADEAGSAAAVGGALTLVSWSVPRGTESWLVVRGADGPAYSTVPLGEVKSTIDTPPVAEVATSCEGGPVAVDAEAGGEDAANGESSLELRGLVTLNVRSALIMV